MYKSGFSTIAPTFLIAFVKLLVISYPLILTVPLVILWSPKISLIVVVFPAPLGPIKPKISPFSNSKETSFKISFFPKFLCKCSHLSTTSPTLSPPNLNF